MKIISFMLITLMALASVISLACSQEQPVNTTLIAISIVKEDILKKRTIDEILIIGKITNGKYEDVGHWDYATKTVIRPRKPLLNTFKNFTVYRRSVAIKEIFLNKTYAAPFSCKELTVGSGESRILVKDLHKYKSNVSEVAKGYRLDVGDFEYKLTKYLAINSDSPANKTQVNSSPIAGQISDEAKTLIKDYAITELTKRNNLIKSDEIEISTLLMYDLNSDKKIEYLFVAKGANENTNESGIFVVNIEKNKISPLLSKGMMTNRAGRRVRPYKLLDVLDVDGDSIPEMIFEVKGWESTGYEIYKFDKGNFIKVFHDATYGC